MGIVLLFCPPGGTQTTPANSIGTQVPSLLAPGNQRLPAWLRFSGEFRDRAEGRTSFSFLPGSGDGYDLTRLRLNMSVTPRKWLRFFVQAQDAQAPGIDSSRLNSMLKDNFDLREAYGEIDVGPHRWIRLRAGRQELSFGAERLVGAFDWSNTARSFDAARLTFAWPKTKVDLFAATVVSIRMTSFDKPQPGVNLYGVYASFGPDSRQSTFQPYFFWKTNPRVKSEEGGTGDEDRATVGFRWAVKWPKDFDSTMEMAGQKGNFANDSIEAWAGYGIAGYRLPVMRFEPRLSAEYDYASGDGRPGDGANGTFDQLYPTNHSYYGIADQVGWRNMRAWRMGTDFSASRKLKLNFDYNFFWLANGRDGLYNAAGTLVVKPPAAGALHTDVGQEPDIFATYALAAEVTLGAGFAHLTPGRFLRENSPGGPTSFAYAFATYRF